LLLDPVFTNAAPLPFLVTRFQKPVLEMEELPPIDLILISHDHYDHLDKQSIAFFRDKETQFIVPLGVSSYLKGWGIDESRITELDWWQEISFSSLKVACTPSQHFSGRRGPRGNKTLWASWAVIGENERFYFSGDSGFDTHFAEIGEKYGPFDVAFMESGQYNPMWHMTHMFPEESVNGGIALKAKSIQPIHWGMFRLSTHDWFEPPEEVRRFGTEKNIMINTPILGEIVQPSTPQVFRAWWRDVDSTTQ
jgi:L-ascorbate metabolism protein UlaG (beta-lactamase superfamily)